MTSSGWNPPETPFLDRARAEALRLPESQDDPRSLKIADQTILAVSSAQGVIDNGGFAYFFGADWPGQPPYSFFSDAYRRIGAEAAANCIDRGVSLFPFAHPERHKNRRKAFLKSLPDTHELIVLGHRVCGDVSVWVLLEQYAKGQSGH